MDKLKTSDEQKAKLVQEEYVDRINRNLSDFKKYIDFTEPVIEAVVVKLQGSGPSSPYDIAYSAKSFLHDLSYEFPYIGDEFDEAIYNFTNAYNDGQSIEEFIKENMKSLNVQIDLDSTEDE